LSELDPAHIAQACETVSRDFPELTDVEPLVSAKEMHPKDGESPRTLYVLSFEGSVPLPGGGSLARTVRVTMDQAGEIIRLVSAK
jgi:hypothetical protein